MKTLTIEQLAEKLKGKLWVKGELKRIYLDEGHNTRKMSTKTYVYQNEDGDFKVSCYIECPSQPYQWIKSQQEEIIDSVIKKIEELIELANVVLVDSRLTSDKKEVEVKISYNEIIEEKWLSENDFYSRFGEYPENVFDNLPEVFIEPKSIIVPVKSPKKEIKVGKTDNPKFGIGSKISHDKFGNGVVTAEDDSVIKANFESVGEKSLIKKYAPIKLIEDAAN